MTVQNLPNTPLPVSPPTHIKNSDYATWSNFLRSADRLPESIYVEAFADIESYLPPLGETDIDPELESLSKTVRTILYEANLIANLKREGNFLAPDKSINNN